MAEMVYAVYVVDTNTQEETLVEFYKSSIRAVKACVSVARQHNTGMVSEENASPVYKTLVREVTEGFAFSQIGV